MQTTLPLNSMLHELWADLHRPDLVWQLVVLGLCLGYAWWRSRVLVRRWRVEGVDDESVTLATAAGRDALAKAALARLTFPTIALGLVLLALPVLGRWGHSNLLRLAVPLLGAYALVQVVVYVIGRLAPNRGLRAFERWLSVAIWIAVALYITGHGEDVVGVLEDVRITFGRQSTNLWVIVHSAFWVLITLLVALWGAGLLESRLLGMASVDIGVRVMLARLLQAVTLVVALLVVLSLIGLDLTALSVFGGALGVGIGLGLQRIASNYVSGFIVLLERGLRIGDVVRINEITGRIHEIRTRYTVVRSADGTDSIIPNEILTGQTVRNLSASGRVRVTLAIPVAPGADLARATDALRTAASVQPRVLADPAPTVDLVAIDKDAYRFELGFWVDAAGVDQQAVKTAVHRDITREFAGAGVGFAGHPADNAAPPV